MKRKRGGRFWGAVALALVLLAALAIWQWETLARWAIIATVERMVEVRLSLGPMTLRTDRAVFEDVQVASLATNRSRRSRGSRSLTTCASCFSAERDASV